MGAPGRLLSLCKASCERTAKSMAHMPGDEETVWHKLELLRQAVCCGKFCNEEWGVMRRTSLYRARMPDLATSNTASMIMKCYHSPYYYYITFNVHGRQSNGRPCKAYQTEILICILTYISSDRP